MSGISGASFYSKVEGTKDYKKYTMLPGETIEFMTRRVFEDITGQDYDLDIKRFKLKKTFNEEKGWVWIWSRKR